MQRWEAGEAVSHLRAALQLLEDLPASHERDRRELDIQMTLGPALLASRGFPEPMLEPTYRRATELAAIHGDHARACLALRGRQIFHFARGELETSLRIAEELHARAYTAPDPEFRIGGHHALGQCLFMLGNFEQALVVLEKGVTISGARDVQIAHWPGGQPTEQCHIYAGFASFMRGEPERAIQHADSALEISSALPNSLSLINTQAFVSAIFLVLGHLERARVHAEAAVEMSREFHNPSFLHYGNVLLGAIDARNDPGGPGIAKMEKGYAAFRAMHFATWTPLMACLLGQAYAACARAREGIELLAREQAQVSKTGEHAWDAEVVRVQGELVLRDTGDWAAAESTLERSLAIARAQEAKGLELRAATSLARLHLAAGHVERARETLFPVRARFSGCVDAPDLAAATSVLEACAARG
jgi:adenylate cyclase